jgi:hypothetical protein
MLMYLIIDVQLLKSNEYFGRYGKVSKVVTNPQQPLPEAMQLSSICNLYKLNRRSYRYHSKIIINLGIRWV